MRAAWLTQAGINPGIATLLFFFLIETWLREPQPAQPAQSAQPTQPEKAEQPAQSDIFQIFNLCSAAFNLFPLSSGYQELADRSDNFPE